jgi:hypothetical protein
MKKPRMTAIGVEQVTSRPARASAANDTPRTALSRVFDDLMLARRNSRLAGALRRRCYWGGGQY